ncbi:MULTISPECIES: phage baseplate assembly protein V [Ralstonia]|jgi:phage baseplate assembly protein V|uniref:Phage baseplate assembly protein V n=1 Tax=Ralstonia pickettii OR214 TaxID=1264675 RepID=R0EC25_RALPI|nr:MULTISPECIES: phage baseplate assembly protein V [Ralstonia]ENZ79634.1 phage baseplate assembly protein V [Ralstonia pickettii OR214]MBE3066864.1 phage baseplate assembly protein V [Chloroflexota bacterium]MBL4778403.1 phage baseplate assembly protein V [Ralstonia sp.]MCM3582168.1 phage baseplate assembly protein V [Ralstonia pickettii]
MKDQDGILERVARRVLLSLARALVTTVNDAGGVQMMQVKLNPLETRDNTPRVAEFGMTSNPPVGSDAFIVFLGGDRSNGVVLGTVHQPSRPTGLAPGETMLYSQDGKYVYMTAAGGIVVEAKNQAVTVSDATTVTINAASKVVMNTPLLQVSGDIIDNAGAGGTNTHTMAQMRTIFNTHTHKVQNVQAGSSTVTTNAPDQTE